MRISYFVMVVDFCSQCWGWGCIGARRNRYNQGVVLFARGGGISFIKDFYSRSMFLLESVALFGALPFEFFELHFWQLGL